MSFLPAHKVASFLRKYGNLGPIAAILEKEWRLFKASYLTLFQSYLNTYFGLVHTCYLPGWDNALCMARKSMQPRTLRSKVCKQVYKHNTSKSMQRSMQLKHFLTWEGGVTLAPHTIKQFRGRCCENEAV